jgi:type VI secretion system protein ImpK
MTKSFSRLVGPVLEHVVGFQQALLRGEQPAIESERRALISLIDETDRAASKAVELAQLYHLARFALIYYIDETLIMSTWKHASAWKNSILELHYFDPPRRAAREFWAKADQAETLARSGKGTDALEIFYLCAALGFRGELVVDEAELVRWFERTYHVLYRGLLTSTGSAGRERAWGLTRLRGGRLLIGVSILVSISALLTALTFIAAVHAR